MKELATFLKTNEKLRPLLDRFQAEDLAMRLTLSLALGTSHVYWATLKDSDPSTTVGWIPVSTGLVDLDGRKKPAYYTYRLLIRELGGFNRVGELKREPTVLRFSFDAKPTAYVAWSDGPGTLTPPA